MVQNRHEYARAWKKRTGGKVLCFCENYMPEELIYAAGMLPVRLFAQHEPDVVSAKWIYASCYPAKDMVNQILSGRYDYMDVIVNVEGCQWMYNVVDVAFNNDPNLAYPYLFLAD